MGKTFILLASMLCFCFNSMGGHSQEKQKRTKRTNGNQSSNPLYWSKFKGSFQNFIDNAIGGVAIIDKPLNISESIAINGDIEIDGKGNTITSNATYLFQLGTGKHVIQNINIQQNTWNACAFYTIPVSNTKWTNTLTNISVDGGKFAYQASRGMGVKSIIENCRFFVAGIAIQVYSQDGNENELILRHVTLKTDSSHHIYIHPNVSVDYYDVTTLGRPLSQNQFSSGNIGYYTSNYARYKKVSSKEISAMWNVAPVKDSGYTIMDSVDMAPYTIMGVKPAKVKATNSRFYNGGNGAMLRGEITNCTGEIWSPGIGDTLVVNGGSYDFISMRTGGSIIMERASGKFISVSDRGNDYQLVLRSCKVDFIDDSKNGNGAIMVENMEVPKNNLRDGTIFKKGQK